MLRWSELHTFYVGGHKGSTGPLCILLRFQVSAPSPFPPLLLHFLAEATINFGELAAVLDAVVGQGQGFLFFTGLEV